MVYQDIHILVSMTIKGALDGIEKIDSVKRYGNASNPNNFFMALSAAQVKFFASLNQFYALVPSWMKAAPDYVNGVLTMK